LSEKSEPELLDTAAADADIPPPYPPPLAGEVRVGVAVGSQWPGMRRTFSPMLSRFVTPIGPPSKGI